MFNSEKMAALGRIAAGLAHEINTPAGVLQSNADLVARVSDKMSHDETGDNARYLGVLKNSSEAIASATSRMAEIVDNLKNFVCLDEGEQKLTNVNASLDTALALLGNALKPGVTVERSYGDVPELKAFGSQLNNVFMTLLSNANDAIEDAGSIYLDTHADADTLTVSVRDTGRGMSERELVDLFDVGFSRSGERMRMRTSLPNAQYVVAAHGGELTAISERGRGTTITVRLPLS